MFSALGGIAVTLQKPAKSPYWQYDFRYHGHRFYGSTKTADRREAEAIEHAERRRVRQFRPTSQRPRPLSDRYRGLCACGEHVWVVLTQGFVTLVSPEDSHLLERVDWFASKDNKLIYVVRHTSGTYVRLHRLILDEPDSDIDHKDHNGLNNQRINLRQCSPVQNGGNSRRRTGFSGFRGVHFEKRTGRWCVSISGNYLGTYATPEQAALAYDAAAIERYGEFATLNFPGGVRHD
jgi:hypothetical protein